MFHRRPEETAKTSASDAGDTESYGALVKEMGY